MVQSDAVPGPDGRLRSADRRRSGALDATVICGQFVYSAM
jgi:hypothetical protein